MREPLAARRSHEAFNFRHWDTEYTVGLGRSPDGAIREVFINGGKIGTQMETLARDSAVLLSIALQYGVPLDTLQHAMTRNADGSASGPIGALLDQMVTA
jgi:hypothetical protein